MSAPPGLVVVGGSWGAIEPVRHLLTGLGTTAAPPPVVAVLHRSRHGTDGALETLLVRGTGYGAPEVEDKSPLTAGQVHVAPADYHLLVEPGQLTLSTEAPVKHSRPSIDVTLTSAAEAYGAAVVAVLLSGASDDGADGARAVARSGGCVLVQDPACAERAELPEAVVRSGVADLVGPVETLTAHLVELVGAPRVP